MDFSKFHSKWFLSGRRDGTYICRKISKYAFSKDGHDLSAGESIGHRFFEQIEITYERVRLFHGVIMMHGYEITIFSVEELTEIFEN